MTIHIPGLLPPANREEDIDMLRNELRISRERHLSTLADFNNCRRRVTRDATRNAEEGARGVLVPFLGIIDDLENALQWAGDDGPSATQGVRLIHQKCIKVLATFGVFPFASVGSAFDHNRHEAVAVAPRNGNDSGTVTDEIRRGYLWNTDLLRAAHVRVAE
jgi:molecular chaperone GrpE